MFSFLGQIATLVFAIGYLSNESVAKDAWTHETVYWLSHLLLGTWSILNLLCYAKCHSTRSKHLRELEGAPDTIRLDAIAGAHRAQIEKVKAESKL